MWQAPSKKTNLKRSQQNVPRASEWDARHENARTENNRVQHNPWVQNQPRDEENDSKDSKGRVLGVIKTRVLEILCKLQEDV